MTQYGKTHVIRETLAGLGCNYIEINLIAMPEAIKILQEFNTVNELIMGLSTLTEKPFVKGESIITWRKSKNPTDTITVSFKGP